MAVKDSIRNAIAIIDYLNSKWYEPQTVAQIAQALDISKDTVRKIIKILRELGLVSRERYSVPNGVYRYRARVLIQRFYSSRLEGSG